MKELIVDLRLLLCGALFNLIFSIAPKDSVEGRRIATLIGNWALQEMKELGGKGAE